VFVSSHPFLVFDHFRVPYEVGGAPEPGHATMVAHTRPGRSLRWPVFETAGSAPGAGAASAPGPRRFRLGSLVLHARVLPDDRVAARLANHADGWRPVEPLTDGGERLGSVWRSESGDVFLPFDPNEVVTAFWSERYVNGAGDATGSTLRSAAVSAYYRVRPLIPRRAQIAARRLYSRVQARTPFPRWPVEDSLHGFLDLVLGWVADLAGEDVPHIAPWPRGRTWALVLTHDVETADGLRRLPVLRDIETAAGFRSSWNLVPRRYDVADEVVAALRADGFEVGLHGLYHDGRDLADDVFPQRLPDMKRWAARWQARGFRSPATHRAWRTMASLPFEYDSSYPDTDPFEPQPGGCCSWLPYFNGSLVELPITLPQDHTLFVILRRRDGRAWIDKGEMIRAAGGMALLITHPDYVGIAPIAAAYRELLDHFADDTSMWRALPVEVNRWWRRRAGSHLERTANGWRIVGPARDEASIAVTAPARRRSAAA
jgi:hypothetical protein